LNVSNNPIQRDKVTVCLKLEIQVPHSYRAALEMVTRQSEMLRQATAVKVTNQDPHETNSKSKRHPDHTESFSAATKGIPGVERRIALEKRRISIKRHNFTLQLALPGASQPPPIRPPSSNSVVLVFDPPLSWELNSRSVVMERRQKHRIVVHICQ
jgi:hypothetical protein